MTEVIQAAYIGGATAIIVAVITVVGVKLKKGQSEIKIIMDGRLQELLETTRKLANAQGNKEGRQELEQETKK